MALAAGPARPTRGGPERPAPFPDPAVPIAVEEPEGPDAAIAEALVLGWAALVVAMGVSWSRGRRPKGGRP